MFSACFVIIGSAYMCNNLLYLLYCTRFDSFVCIDVWCSSQTHLDCDDLFYYQGWCII